MDNYREEINVAGEIARQAGRILLEYYAKDLKIDLKPGDEPVTEADKAANEFILAQLKKEFPQDLLISEECTDEERRLTASRFWLIDPLDGTKEFIARNGEFSVMIGLVVDGKAVAGAIYQPTTDRLWLGNRNYSRMQSGGQEIELKVSDIAATPEMTAVISRSHRNATIDTILNRLRITKQISMGSGGIKLGMIASREGEVMFSPSPGYKIWDICAPEAVIAGAGGIVTDFRGEPIDYRNANVRVVNGIFASNNTRHHQMLSDIANLVTLPFKVKEKNS